MHEREREREREKRERERGFAPNNVHGTQKWINTNAFF